jgi:hypothetical protein
METHISFRPASCQNPKPPFLLYFFCGLHGLWDFGNLPVEMIYEFPFRVSFTWAGFTGEHTPDVLFERCWEGYILTKNSIPRHFGASRAIAVDVFKPAFRCRSITRLHEDGENGAGDAIPRRLIVRSRRCPQGQKLRSSIVLSLPPTPEPAGMVDSLIPGQGPTGRQNRRSRRLQARFPLPPCWRKH